MSTPEDNTETEESTDKAGERSVYKNKLTERETVIHQKNKINEALVVLLDIKYHHDGESLEGFSEAFKHMFQLEKNINNKVIEMGLLKHFDSRL